jgi:aspartate kinase
MVVQEQHDLEKIIVAGIACDKNEAKVQLINVPDRPGIVATVFGELAEQNISVDMIIQSPSRRGDQRTDVTFTVPKSDLPRCRDMIQKASIELGGSSVEYDTDIVKVSIVGLGMRSHAGVAAKMFRILSEDGINIHAISTSEIKISCIIEAKYAELAVRALHAGFGLERSSANSTPPAANG